MRNHRHASRAGAPARRGLVAALMLLLIVVFYLLREHWDHALGLAPYVLLLACPLMHLFHGSHGSRARTGGGTDAPPAAGREDRP